MGALTAALVLFGAGTVTRAQEEPRGLFAGAYDDGDLDERLVRAEASAIVLLGQGEVARAYELLQPVARMRARAAPEQLCESAIRVEQLKKVVESEAPVRARLTDAFVVLYRGLDDLRRRNELLPAADAATKVGDVFEADIGGDSIDLGYARLRAAWLYQRAGRFDNAAAEARRAHVAFCGSLGARHSRTLETAALLGESLRLAGRLDAARDAYRAAIAEAPPASEALAELTRGLGSCELKTGNLGEAKRLLQALLEEQERSSSDPQAISFTTHLLAQVLHAKGAYREAESLYSKTIQIRQLHAGMAHPDTVTAYHNMAALLLRTGQFDRAASLERHVIEALDHADERRDMERASAFNNLGLALLASGDQEGAVSAFTQSLALREARLPPEDERIAVSLANLALAHIRRGDSDAGITAFARASQIAAARNGATHPTVLSIRSSYAAALADIQDRRDEARVILDETLARGREAGGPGLAHLLLNRAQFAFGPEKNYELAASLFRQACDEFEQRRADVAGDEFDRARNFAVMEAVEAYRGLSRSLLATAAGDPCGLRSGPRVTEALVAFDQARARGLAEALARGIMVPEQIVGDRWKLVEAERARVDAAERELAAAMGADGDALAIAAARERLEGAKAALRDARRDAFASAAMPVLAPTEPKLDRLWEKLGTGRLLLVYDVGATESIQYVTNGSGLVRAICLRWPDGTAVTQETMRTRYQTAMPWLSGDSQTGDRAAASLSAIRDLYEALLPATLRNETLSAGALSVVADSVVQFVPLDAIAGVAAPERRAAFPSVSYVPSVSLFITGLPARDDSTEGAALLYGGPVYEVPVAGAPQASDNGVYVAWVRPRTAASRSGVQPGDVIVDVDGAPAIDASAVATLLEQKRAKLVGVPPVTLNVLRNGVTHSVTLAFPFLGMRLSPLPLEMARASARRANLPLAELADGDETEEPNPDVLPGSELELAGVAAALARSGIGAGRISIKVACDATRPSLQSRLGTGRWIHLALHGMSTSGHPSDSAVLFSRCGDEGEGWRLTLGDVLLEWSGKLRGAELVVLSACETGRGPVEQGEGAFSIGWGVMAAGARSVVVSRWRVDDEATALLMTRFYENLLGVSRKGEAAEEPVRRPDANARSAPAALREAQLWLRELTRDEADRQLAELRAQMTQRTFVDGRPRSRDPRRRAIALANPSRPFSHPCYWAAFSVISLE